MKFEDLMQANAALKSKLGLKLNDCTLLCSHDTENAIEAECAIKEEVTPIGAANVMGMRVIPLEDLKQDEMILFTQKEVMEAFLKTIESLKRFNVTPRPFIEAVIKMIRTANEENKTNPGKGSPSFG